MATQTEKLRCCEITRITVGWFLVAQHTCAFLKLLVFCLEFWLSFKGDKTAAIMVAQKNPISQFTHLRLSNAEILKPLMNKRSKLACTPLTDAT